MDFLKKLFNAIISFFESIFSKNEDIDKNEANSASTEQTDTKINIADLNLKLRLTLSNPKSYATLIVFEQTLDKIQEISEFIQENSIPYSENVAIFDRIHSAYLPELLNSYLIENDDDVQKKVYDVSKELSAIFDSIRSGKQNDFENLSAIMDSMLRKGDADAK